MKIDFSRQHDFHRQAAPIHAVVSGETDRLTDVVLCGPSSLSAVPCCSVTRESIRNGFEVSAALARTQHARLVETLTRRGVRCHALPAHPDFADQCFTRDAAVTTPWGLVGLNPALPHRRAEVDHMLATLARTGVAVRDRVTKGTIEGGDVCIARPGLLIVGMSGERTTPDGADDFAARFERHGWRVLRYAFDPHFLHLDTMFCMLDDHRALACVDVLDDAFLEALAGEGIELLPVRYKDARRLGCNVLSVDGHTIVMSAGLPDVAERLRQSGFEALEVDTSQFAACGGGIHCLTMPLRREPKSAGID